MDTNCEMVGKKIRLRLVNENDAEFIISLRKNPLLNQYISETDSSIEQQIEWIRKYKQREAVRQEYYFIVEDLAGKAVGTVRIYDIDYAAHKCNWGSFILNADSPERSSYEVVKLSTDFAFSFLKIRTIHLDVRRMNARAIYIYEKCGFKRISEDQINYYYVLESEQLC